LSLLYETNIHTNSSLKRRHNILIFVSSQIIFFGFLNFFYKKVRVLWSTLAHRTLEGYLNGALKAFLPQICRLGLSFVCILHKLTALNEICLELDLSILINKSSEHLHVLQCSFVVHFYIIYRVIQFGNGRFVLLLHLS